MTAASRHQARLISKHQMRPCLSCRASRLRLLQIAPTVLRGTHIRLPEVWFARAAEARVESDPPRMIYADGEPICRTPVRVSVVPQGLRVVVP